MIRAHSAGLALLSLTRSSGAYKSIECVLFGIFLLDFFPIGIFLWCVFCISLCEFELSFALEALDKVAHLPDGFVL